MIKGTRVKSVSFGAAAFALTLTGVSLVSPSAASAASSPVKIMVMTTLNTSAGINTFPEDPAGAKAAALAINKEGGIDGHKLSIITCDDTGTAAGAETCARDAVSDGVLEVANGSLLSSDFEPILEAANIPMVNNSALSPPDFTDAVSFPIGATVQDEYAETAVAMIKQGDKKIGIARWDTSADLAAVDAIEYAVKKAGGTIVGVPSVPLTATDYSPYIESLKAEGANGVVLVSGNNEIIGMIQSSPELGFTPKYSYPLGLLTNAQQAKLLPGVTGVLEAGTLPLVSDTKILGVKLFNEQMKAEQNTGDSNAKIIDSESLGMWLSVWGTANALKGVTGTLSGPKLLTTLNHTSSVNLFGIADWSPDKPGPAGTPRVNGSTVFPFIVNSKGVTVPDGGPIDMAKDGYVTNKV